MARHNHVVTPGNIQAKGHGCPACDEYHDAVAALEAAKEGLLPDEEPDPVEQYCEAMHEYYEEKRTAESPRRVQVPWSDVPDVNKAAARYAMRMTLIGFLEDIHGRIDEIEGTELKRTGHVGGFPIWLHTQDAVRDWISNLTDEIENGEV